MKKTFAILLIGCMMLAAACGGNTEGTADTAASAAEEPDEGTAAKETETAAPEKEAPAETAAPEEEDDFEPLGPFKKEVNIEETVLFDENDVKITATGLTYENYAVDLDLRFENNSDRNLEFTAQSLGYSCNAVNGFMIQDGYVRCDVPAGGTAEEAVDFGYSELLLHGITEIATIQTGFSISDEDYDRFTTGPLEVATPIAEGYDFGPEAYRKTIQSKAVKYTYDLDLASFSEEEVYSSGGIGIVSEAYMINKDGERMLLLEIENTTEDIAYAALRDIKVNDTLVSEGIWTSDTITGGKRMLMDIALDNILDEEEWAALGIEEVESVGFTIEVKNTDGMAMAEPKEITIEV